jgi:hypothetical protein
LIDRGAWTEPTHKFEGSRFQNAREGGANSIKDISDLWDSWRGENQ